MCELKSASNWPILTFTAAWILARWFILSPSCAPKKAKNSSKFPWYWTMVLHQKRMKGLRESQNKCSDVFPLCSVYAQWIILALPCFVSKKAMSHCALKVLLRVLPLVHHHAASMSQRIECCLNRSTKHIFAIFMHSKKAKKSTVPS